MYRQKFPARIGYEKNSGVSMVQPDPNHLSVRQILNYHSRGMEVPGHVMINDEDENIHYDDIRSYDLVELQQMKRDAEQKLHDYQVWQKAEADKKEELRRRDFYRKQFAKEKETTQSAQSSARPAQGQNTVDTVDSL